MTPVWAACTFRPHSTSDAYRHVQIAEFLLAIPALLFSMVAHEFAHGYAALRQGDTTARDLGRVTLNPIKHIDLWMTLLLPTLVFFGSGGRVIFGGAKPVPVNPANYRHYRRGDIIVSSAGIVVNLGLVVVFGILAGLVGAMGAAAGEGGVAAPLQRVMFWGVWFNILLANFNLIPIPPLDGSHLFYHLLPPQMGRLYRQGAKYGFLILLGIVFFVPQVLFTLLLPGITLLGWILAALEPVTLQPFGLF